MGNVFHLFEPLPPELAGGRKAQIIKKKGLPTRYLYRVKRESAFDFYNRLKAAGVVFFLI